MANNSNNPWEGFFERREQERQQEQERLRTQREQINNERQIQAQRLLANKTGNELAKILSIINPKLSSLGLVLGSTAEYTKQVYNALDEMSSKLSEVSAAAKLLGINIDGLDGASEMNKDILELKNTWNSFIEEVELGISKIYKNVKDNIEDGNMSDSQLNDLAITGVGLLFGGGLLANLANMPVLKGVEDELDKRQEKEEEVNKQLDSYADALDIQIDNIMRNKTATQNELIGYASTGVTSLAGAGVSSEVDQNRWTSLILGYTEKIFRDMEGSVGFDDIYQDVLNFFVGGKTEGLNKYGYGLTEESFYGYAQQYENMFLGSTKYREDKMIETRFNYFDTWINSTDELKESMYDLGYEVKNNTNALQKWQWLESISSISTEKGSSDYKDYFAVDQDGNIITDSVFGSESSRFNDEIKANIKKLGDTSHMSLDEILIAAGMTLPTVGDWSKGAVRLDDLVSNNVNPGTSGRGLSIDQLARQNELLGLSGNRGLSFDQLVRQNETLGTQQNVNIHVTASDNLKVEIEKSVTKNLWDTLKDSFQKDIQTLPERLGNIF